MSDIERLRQDVINAAREYKQSIHGYDKPMRVSVPNDEGADRFFAAHNKMIGALDALDEAERPDPWELLRGVQDMGGVWFDDTAEMRHKARDLDYLIDKALAWKEAQQ